MSYSKIRILPVQTPLGTWLGLGNQPSYGSSVYHQVDKHRVTFSELNCPINSDSKLSDVQSVSTTAKNQTKKSRGVVTEVPSESFA